MRSQLGKAAARMEGGTDKATGEDSVAAKDQQAIPHCWVIGDKAQTGRDGGWKGKPGSAHVDPLLQV